MLLNATLQLYPWKNLAKEIKKDTEALRDRVGDYRDESFVLNILRFMGQLEDACTWASSLFSAVNLLLFSELGI